MRKTKIRLTLCKANGKPALCVTIPQKGRGRSRKFFPDTKDGRKEAKAFMQLARVRQENYGTASHSLNDSQRAEYLECCEQVKPFGVSLRDAVALVVPQLRAANRTCNIAELIAEMVSAKRADGASVRYLGDLKSRLQRFADSFNERVVSSFSAQEVDAWLRNLPYLTTTRNNYRRILIVAFNYARQNGYCASNPADKCAKAKQIATPPGILDPTEVASILEHCDGSLVPLIAIGAFAGLRRAEIERLDWSEIDIAGGFIEVTARNAKSSCRRLVKIHDNLAAWLEPHAKKSGSIVPPNTRRLLDGARRAIGITWPANALRHSFASYHMGKFKDAAALALEMGHSDTGLIFQHYRELVRPAAADRYWNIRPVVARNVLAMTA